MRSAIAPSLHSETDTRPEELSMRTVTAQIYDYSLDGISAEEDTIFFDFCRALPDDPASLEAALDFYRKADLLVMGRTHYQGASAYFPSADDDPYADVMNAAPKVVFSHTLATADWANTTVNNGDLAAEIEKLKLGGDGYIIADGGLGLLRSLIRCDLVDEFRIYLVPYLAGKGPRVFDDSEQPTKLELVSVTPVGGGISELIYRPIR
jgi:dihydrofolate reductase